MKDLKAFLVIVILTGIVYWGVEPYAHSVMHPHVEPANFDFKAEDMYLAKKNLKEAKDEKNKAIAEDRLKAYEDFWKEIDEIDFSKGNAQKGEELVQEAGCTGCHGIKAADLPAPMSSKEASEAYGVNPPDLSTAGYLYEPKFLAAFIKNPVMAFKVSHKFNDDNPFPMPEFAGVGDDINSELADMVAYFKSIAPKEMSDKEVFVNSCVRCHDMKYANLYTDGNKASIANYLGTTPPDLSMYIRSRSVSYLNDFINDPQKMLAGTAMPRVGLDAKAQKQVINYMEKVGDSKKAEREDLGWKVMLYFLILSFFAYLWKRKVWASLH